jgi:hypothetical protein
VDPITALLDKHGPNRSSAVAARLQDEFGLTPEAARKRLSRIRAPLRSFPIPLLPKREAFLYRQQDRNTERFWTNLHRDLRETESVMGAAIDGLAARGGIVSADEFAVISGAPVKQLKQVPSALVLNRLESAGLVKATNYTDLGDVVMFAPSELGTIDVAGFKSRRQGELVILDGIREWAKRLGVASYNTIAIRGDDHPRMVGPYKWDLTGPSYLMPLRGMKGAVEQQGFLVADAFVGTALDHHQLRYFIRKAQSLRATTKVGSILPMIVAQGFTPEALTLGHKAGLLLATPATLFGTRAAQAFDNLIETMRNAAAIVSKNPEGLIDLLGSLQDIEGRAGNLRGVLFELFCAYLVRNDGNSIDVGRKAFDPKSGKFADIDVMCVRGHSECVLYECKGKVPGGTVSQEEVEDWLRRLPIFKAHVRMNDSLREADIHFQLWTSGDFQPDALAILEQEKQRRTKDKIDWKNGRQVRALSIKGKEKAITSAFDEHFFRHPLNI